MKQTYRSSDIFRPQYFKTAATQALEMTKRFEMHPTVNIRFLWTHAKCAETL
jgi:hypothetical protein